MNEPINIYRNNIGVNKDNPNINNKMYLSVFNYSSPITDCI